MSVLGIHESDIAPKRNNSQATASTCVCIEGLAWVVEWSEPVILQQVNSVYALASVNAKRCRSACIAEG